MRKLVLIFRKSHPMVLVSGNSCKGGFLKYEGLEVVLRIFRVGQRFRGQINYMESWLVSVHGIQDYLQR